ncbi:MAG: M3 family oligoendopeptidase [Sphaerochaeta sp.]
MQTLPTWDLSPIYPSVDSKEFLADLGLMTSRSRVLEVMITSPSAELPACIAEYEAILDYQETLDAYSSACLTTDTANELYLKATAQVEEASLVVQHLEVAFRNFLASRSEEIAKRTETGGDLEPYRFVLSELLEEQAHQMESELEALASDLARSGTDAFSRLQEAMGSSIHVADEDSQPKTLVELRNEASNPDREVRKRAFEQELSLLKAYEIPFAAALNGVKGTTISLDGRRGYASPLDRSLSQSRIDRQVLAALISTIENNLPVFRTYLKHKAAHLGVDDLSFYDLFAPLGSDEHHYSYEDAHELIVEQFSAFSPEMGLFADQAFKQRWIDAGSRKGKVGGAYDTAFPLAKQSRILANFDYAYGGVSTLAHELGHAWHDHVVLDKSNLLRSYPMTLAETASIFSEFLVFQGVLERSTGSARVTLVEHFLQEACQVCVDILSRFYFESAVFGRRVEGDLSAAEFCSLMEEAQQKTYGDALQVKHPYMWAVKGHYYSSDFSFYNYPYAFGQLFALGLYEVGRTTDHFDQQYNQVLSLAGSLDARQVASSVGIDLADPAFWQRGIDVIAAYVKELGDALPN